jgi:hypothetical protein
MYAVVGRVQIKPGNEEMTRSMIAKRGVPMIQGMSGSAGAYWAGPSMATSSSTRSGSLIPKRTP